MGSVAMTRSRRSVEALCGLVARGQADRIEDVVQKAQVIGRSSPHKPGQSAPGYADNWPK